MDKESICPACGADGIEYEAELSNELAIAMQDGLDSGLLSLEGHCSNCKASMTLEFTLVFTGYSDITEKD